MDRTFIATSSKASGTSARGWVKCTCEFCCSKLSQSFMHFILDPHSQRNAWLVLARLTEILPQECERLVLQWRLTFHARPDLYESIRVPTDRRVSLRAKSVEALDASVPPCNLLRSALESAARECLYLKLQSSGCNKQISQLGMHCRPRKVLFQFSHA